MVAPLSTLDPDAGQRLLSGLNYLNTAELRRFCRKHGISWKILAEQADGTIRATKDADRKAVVLGRVRVYLTTGVVEGPTIYPSSALSDGPLPDKPGPNDRLFYGRYNKRHVALMAALKQQTGGRFRDGAVARILLNEFWTNGQAPTIAEFATAWSTADRKGLGIARGEHPEAAYLTDRAAGRADDDWKAKRTAIANRVMAILDEL